DMLAGGIAVEDLEQEQVDGRDGVERPPSPAMSGGLAGIGDGPGAESGGEVLSEGSEDGSESRWHRGGSVRCVASCPPPSCRESSPCSTCHKASEQQGFGFAFMPFGTGSRPATAGGARRGRCRSGRRSADDRCGSGNAAARAGYRRGRPW